MTLRRIASCRPPIQTPKTHPCPRRHFPTNTCCSPSMQSLQYKNESSLAHVPLSSFTRKSYSKLRSLRSKPSYLGYSNPTKLDAQERRFISGAVAIAVRDMKSFVRYSDIDSLMAAYHDIHAKFPMWAIKDHWAPLHIQILQAFMKAQDPEACEEWFRKHFNSSYAPNPAMPSLKHWSHYNTLMTAYAQKGDVEKVKELASYCFRDAPEAVFSVEVHTTILKSYIQHGNLEEAERFFFSNFRTTIRPTWSNQVRGNASQKVMPSIQTYTSMLSFYAKYGLVDRAKEVFDAALRDIPKEGKKAAELHNAMMEAYALSSGEYEMMAVFSNIFRSTLTAETRNNRLLPSTYTYIVMMEFYLKKGDPKSAIFLFNLMMNDKKLFGNNYLTPQPKLYTILINAYVETDSIDQAISTLYYRNIRYNIDVFLKVASYLAEHGLVDKMRAVVRHMQERFGSIPQEVLPYVVSAYCKKDVEGALHVFQASFVSPVDFSELVRSSPEIEAMSPVEGLNSTREEKIEPSDDLVCEILVSLAKEKFPEQLYQWIEAIHQKNFIELDIDLMNYLLLTMIENGHIEEAGDFAIRYFTGQGNGFQVQANDRSVEIMREGDILSYVESNLKESDERAHQKPPA